MLRQVLGLAAALLVSACAAAPGQPVIGTWYGSPPGPDPSFPQAVTLTLYGQASAAEGHYAIATLTRGGGDGSLLSRQNNWSGRWTRATEMDNGAPRQVIHLHDALASMINRYAVGPGNVLQPTSAYLHRDLTGRETNIFSLAPAAGAQVLPQ